MESKWSYTTCQGLAIFPALKWAKMHHMETEEGNLPILYHPHENIPSLQLKGYLSQLRIGEKWDY